MSITVSQILEEITCWCGMQFAIPSALNTHHTANAGHEVYCPLGHSAIRLRKSYKQEIADLVLKIQQKDNLLADERDKKERLERRIQKGVCPYCKRSFPNLKAHMACKHKRKKP